VVAVLLAVASAASAVNAFVGYYPTVGVAFDDLAGVPVPAQIDRAQLSSVDPHTKHGRVVAVRIPADYSHFAHRLEFVYLPPAWFRTGRKEHFPVVEMIGAEFAEPDNWIRIGGAVTAADAYADHHDGRRSSCSPTRPAASRSTPSASTDRTAQRRPTWCVTSRRT
jgi:hypothetical protein